MSAYTVKVRAQVKDFFETLGMEDARKLKRALTLLAQERGDITALHEPLEGYYRLRVGSYRVIFAYSRGQVIECVYAGHRSLVYEVLERELINRITNE